MRLIVCLPISHHVLDRRPGASKPIVVVDLIVVQDAVRSPARGNEIGIAPDVCRTIDSAQRLVGPGAHRHLNMSVFIHTYISL